MDFKDYHFNKVSFSTVIFVSSSLYYVSFLTVQKHSWLSHGNMVAQVFILLICIRKYLLFHCQFQEFTFYHSHTWTCIYKYRIHFWKYYNTKHIHMKVWVVYLLWLSTVWIWYVVLSLYRQMTSVEFPHGIYIRFKILMTIQEVETKRLGKEFNDYITLAWCIIQNIISVILNTFAPIASIFKVLITLQTPFAYILFSGIKSSRRHAYQWQHMFLRYFSLEILIKLYNTNLKHRTLSCIFLIHQMQHGVSRRTVETHYYTILIIWFHTIIFQSSKRPHSQLIFRGCSLKYLGHTHVAPVIIFFRLIQRKERKDIIVIYVSPYQVFIV